MMSILWVVLLVALTGTPAGQGLPLRSTPQAYPHESSGGPTASAWGAGGLYAAVPALALVIAAVVLLLGCTWCYRHKDCKADDTFLIKKKGKYCPYCGKYTVVRKNTTCPNCKADWCRAGGRCDSCRAAIDPGWSFCELCGMETARAIRLKRAKHLSHLHRAKVQKAPPPPPSKSPDLFGPDPTGEELESIEATLASSCCDQQSEKTPATDATNVSDISTEDDVVADSRDSS